MSRPALLLLLPLLACGDPPPPLTSERGAEQAVLPPPVAAAPSTSPSSAAAPAQPAGPTWTPETVTGLNPAPRRTASSTPTPMVETPEIAATLAILDPIITKYASDPQNPWGMAHALLARGGDFTLPDGRSAVAALFQDWAEPLAIGSHTLLRFPKTSGAARVEPHTGLLLKAMTEGGVDPQTEVHAAGKTYHIADLYRASLASTWLDIAKNDASFSSPDDMPWLLQGLAAWAPPGDMRWTAVNGKTTDLSLMVRFSAAVLGKETQFLAEAMRSGKGFEREGQGIFRYTCGGAHLLQGTAYAVAVASTDPREHAAIEAQIPIFFYRFPRELAITDEALEQHPEHQLRLLVQRLKFTGHALETAEKLEILGFYTPNAEQTATLNRIVIELISTVKQLHDIGAYSALEKIRAQDEQVYLDIVGDSSHAFRGLELALGLQVLH